MSDAVDDFNKQAEARLNEEIRKRELQEKKALLEEHRVNLALDKITQTKEELEKAKSTNFEKMTTEQIDDIVKQNSDYMEAAKNALMFINNTFNSIVPFFRKNLILIGAMTGDGKSTAVANIALPILTEKRKSDGKLGSVLVITNEEKAEDVYNRITCLAKGWHYVNHDQFTEEQRKTFDSWIVKLAANGRLNVIDDNYGGVPGTTTTLEGVCGIFDNLIENGVIFDAVIFDYYQNVNESKKEPKLSQYEVQAKLATALDRYKNIYPAPIVVLAQLNPQDKDKKTPFKHRIEGRKVILNAATACIEMVKDKINFRTEWVLHKGRFNEFLGSSVYTGYQKGKFVPYNEAFSKSQADMMQKRLEDAALLSNVGKDGKDIKPVDEEKKKG